MSERDGIAREIVVLVQRFRCPRCGAEILATPVPGHPPLCGVSGGDRKVIHPPGSHIANAMEEVQE